MKRLIFGDIHGRFDTLFNIYNEEEPDEVIILGDYFDPYDAKYYDTMYDDFIKLVSLQENHLSKNKGQFILLLGNHDYHYLKSVNIYGRSLGCSRYSLNTYNMISELLTELYNDKLVTLLYIDDINKTIYSHAGLSNCFVNDVAKVPDIHEIDNDFNLSLIDFNMYSGWDTYGDTKSQSFIWIRPGALIDDCYDKEWTQVVGHTRFKKPFHTTDDKENTNGTDIYFIDSLENGHYLVEILDDENKITNRYIK